MYLINSFSAGMLTDFPAKVDFSEIDVKTARLIFEKFGLQSAVGHADTAAVFSAALGMPVEFNRTSVSLHDYAVLGQYVGPRLPEGATQLPEGASIKWLLIEVQYPSIGQAIKSGMAEALSQTG
jgi:uncharacterized protein DUF1874